jgi:predicted Rossmann fold nucleotide-binding protein DprA/Smf involved in DNA uptake
LSAFVLTGVCRRCERRARPVTRLVKSSDRSAGQAQPRRVCRHHCAYPQRLASDPLAPDVIEVHGGIERLRRVLGRDIVAFAGAHNPSDYGLRCARTLAREIAAAGVTVAIAEDDLGTAARAGALQAGGETIVLGSLHTCDRLAVQSTLALLADLVIVVEADEERSGLTAASVAASRGVAIAAVPGPIDSPASRLSNRLIADEGALSLRGAEHALDALAGVGVRRPRQARKRRCSRPHDGAKRSARAKAAALPESHLPAPPHGAESELEPRLAGVLERVRGGEDTLAKLCLGERDCEERALALTELELIGLLQRSPDGRYLPSAAGHLR